MPSLSDWDLIPLNKAVGIPILKNGSLCNAVHLDKKHIIVRETCAFDSILQIVVNAIATYEKYKDNVSDTENHFVQLAQNVLLCGKVHVSHYSQRAKILCNIPIFTIASYTRKME